MLSELWNVTPGWVFAFCLCCVVFPRVTLLLTVPFGGFAWWVGWVFAPRLTIAILAIPFFEVCPGLVVCAWLNAVIIGTLELAAASAQTAKALDK